MKCSRIIRLAAILLGLCSTTILVAANGGDFRAIDIEVQAKAIAAHNATAASLDVATRADAQQLLDRALQLQLSVERGDVRISPVRQRSLERTIDNLQERVAASDALTLQNAPTTTALIQGHVYPAPNTAGVAVRAKNFSSNSIVANTNVATDGSYSLSLPAPGTYTLSTPNAGNFGYLAQSLGGLNCSDVASAPRYYTGNMLVVASDGTFSQITPTGVTASGLDFTLTAAASISGTVLSGSNPVVGASVQADIGSGWGVVCGVNGTTDSGGNFVIRGLTSGRYVVWVDGNSIATPVQDTQYPSVACGEADCSFGPQTYVSVTVGGNTALSAPISVGATPSSVSGAVLDATTSSPIVGAAIALISEDGWTYDSGNITTNASGAYTVPQVRPANYRIVATAPGYVGGVYLNSSTTRACVDPMACDPIGIGGIVTVGNGVALTNYNLMLSRGARVSGTVTRASDHTAVVGATVTFGNSVATVVSPPTDASGNYTASGLPDGIYAAYASIPTSPALNLAPTGADGLACEGDYGGCTGAPLTVSAVTPLTGVNFAMASGGTLTGVIRDSVSGAPTPYSGGGNWRIDLLDANNHLAAQLLQTSAAAYATYGLPPGTYTGVFASSSWGAGWIDVATNGQPCPRRSCDKASLPKIVVSASIPASVNGTMPRGAKMRGQVLDAATSQPILLPGFDPTFNGSVVPIANPPFGGGFGNPDGTGYFSTRQGFVPGTYYSETVWEIQGTNTFAPFGAGYVDQAYAGIVCPYVTCNLVGATSFQIGTLATGDVTGINYVLSQGGSITGTVTGTGAVPLNGVAMSAFNSTGKLVAQAQTNALGAYRLRGLPTGNYFVTTTNTLGDIDVVYGGVLCTPICNPVNGTPVSVTAPSVTSGKDFALQSSASISGTVSGTHSASVTVQIYGAIGNLLGSAVTASGGGYSFSNLVGGTYFVRTANAYGDIDALYNNLSCVGSACQVTSGTPISVAAGASQSGINLVLTAPGRISGLVKDSANNLSGILLDLYDVTGHLAESTTSAGTLDGSGNNYTLASLPTGTYYVVARSSQYIDVSYPNAPCPATTCTGNTSGASGISVTSGSATIANFTLGSVPSIGGNVNSGSGPIVGAIVQAYDTNNLPVAAQATDATGHYQFTNLADGNYYLHTQNGKGYLDQLYNGIPCSGYCAGGTTISIVGGIATPSNIIFTLAPGSSISGNVTSGGSPLALVVTVQAFDVNGNSAGSAATDANGHYRISGLNPGDYTLRTTNLSGYVNQVYNGTSCSPTPCYLASGTPVHAAGATTVGDIVLARGGTISGIATDPFNNPISRGTAILFGSSGAQISQIATTPVTNGVWEFNGLASGTYYALIENNVGLIDQLYASVPCPGASCTISSGTPIVLSGPFAPIRMKLAPLQNPSAIDLVLPSGAQFSGNVTDGATSGPVVGATVYFFNPSGTLVAQGTTNSLGNYTSASGLPAATYYAATTDGTHAGAPGYVNALYNGQTCTLNCNVTSGNPLSAGAGAVNFVLSKGLVFAGVVTDTHSNALSAVTINVYNASNALAAIAVSDSLGHYSATGLPAGTYYARSINNIGLLDVLYGGTPCPGNCNVLAGTPIVINNASQPQNINLSLIPDRVFRNGFE